MKLIDFLREFKYVEPRDEAHYRQLMKDLQDIQNDPKQYAQVGKLNFMKRKAALDAWADKNLPKSEDGVQATDMKRVGAMGKTLYVHKDGKTIMIPAEREKEFIAKGFKRSALRTEDQVDERMPASIIKHKEKLAHMSDEELAKHFQDKDDNTLRQMAWRHGYGKMSDYYVNRKNKGMSQDTNEGEMRMDKSAFVQMLANKIQEPQKGQGKPEYDNRLLAKMYKLITGRDVGFDGDKFTITMNKPTTEDLDYRSEDILNKAGFDPADIDTYMKVFNDHGNTSDIKQMNMKEKVGLADAMSIVLASHGISNESETQEDVKPGEPMPQGKPMDPQMKAMISLYNDPRVKQDPGMRILAAIRYLQKFGKEIPGFNTGEFNQDQLQMYTKAKVSKGQSLRQIGQAAGGVQEDADIDAQFKSDVLQFLNSKVVQIEKQIELQPANTAEEKENKEFALKLFNFVQAKLEQKDDATNTLTVPKSMIKKK